MSRHLRVLVPALLLAACSSAQSRSGAKIDPEALVDMGIDMFGVVVDMPNRSYLGESTAPNANRPSAVYRWLTEPSLLDRGSAGTWIAVEDLQRAGLPILDQGTELDFTGGMYRPVRYRLGGTLDDIRISQHYEVRLQVNWQLYDTETGSMAYTGSSSGLARGQTLGLTGIKPNAMLDAFQNCLGGLVAVPEIAALIAADSPTS